MTKEEFLDHMTFFDLASVSNSRLQESLQTLCSTSYVYCNVFDPVWMNQINIIAKHSGISKDLLLDYIHEYRNNLDNPMTLIIEDNKLEISDDSTFWDICQPLYKKENENEKEDS